MKPKVYIYISTYKYTYIYILCIIYILYVYLCVCVCMCVYVICRPIAIVPTDLPSKNYSTHFFFSLPSLRFFQWVQFAIWFFFASLTTRENERIIGQGTRVRSSYGATFLSKSFPYFPRPIFLEKKIAPKN